MINMRSRLWRVAFVIVTSALSAATIDHVATTPTARAETPEKATKAPPAPVDLSKKEIVSDCVVEAYADLAKEIPALRAAHADDAKGFDDAYAARKAELVGTAALSAKKCAPVRVE